MQEIMDKLNNATSAKPSKTSQSQTQQVTGNVSPDAQEMYNILHKLQNATEEGAKQLVKESSGPDPIIIQDKEQAGFGFGDLNVVMRKASVYGYKKTFYTVMEGDEIVAEDLALFESAMGIIKNVLGKNEHSKTTRIIDLDEQYGIRFDEAAQHKARAKTLTESVKQDVQMAKHSVAVDKMRNIKAQIKKLI
jgi:hypothetical protein